MFDDEESVRRLRETVDAHLSGGQEAHAMQALEGLGVIRSDLALLNIHAISLRAKGKLKKRAEQLLEFARGARGLTRDELEDRIVPELGLDERGTISLDYGPRRFDVVFDEQLVPHVRDADGTRLASLPRPKDDDDVTKAARATERWKLLKEDATAMGAIQARRLEGAMCTGRKWTHDAFTRYFVAHRLMKHFGRRLVFSSVGSTASPLAFRIAEDGSYADANDAALELDAAAQFAIAHPARLSDDERARWERLLADYEVVQPFPQIGREVFTALPEEMEQASSERFAGAQVPGRGFFGLKHRGWEVIGGAIAKRLPGRVLATLETTPGVGWLARMPEDQTLGRLVLTGSTFGKLDAVVRSELFRDVELLRR